MTINQSQFTINNTADNRYDVSLINGIRRIMTGEIPVIAVNRDSVLLPKNTSVFNDDFLSHRLSMMPVDNEFLKNENIEFINFTCEMKNEKEGLMDVLSGDFEFTHNEKGKLKNLFVSQTILFCRLKFGQEVSVRGSLILGVAKDNGAAFSPVASPFYIFEKDNKAIEEMKKGMDNKEKKDFESKDENRVYLKTDKDTPLKYNFKFDTLGSFEPKTIIDNTMVIYKKKLEDIKNNIIEKKTDSVYIYEPEVELQCLDFRMNKEDDTVGNLISSYLYYDEEVSYAAYVVPHPLDKTVIVRLSLKENNTIENIIKKFLNKIQYLIGLINEFETKIILSNSGKKEEVKDI